MPVLNPEHLLDQADRLLAPAAVGAPRQADLRRAVSDAYYALFHEVLIAAADDFVGSTQRASTRYALLYRSVDHRSLRRICDQVLKKKIDDKYAIYAPTRGFGDDLISLANAVIELQEKRIQADYDPLFRISPTDATLAVGNARKALARFRAANRASRKTFLSLLVFSPR